jgi:hypothetical protein
LNLSKLIFLLVCNLERFSDVFVKDSSHALLLHRDLLNAFELLIG